MADTFAKAGSFGQVAVDIDFDAVYAGIKAYIESVTEKVGERMLARAKAKAPVRKIFYGSRRTFRRTILSTKEFRQAQRAAGPNYQVPRYARQVVKTNASNTWTATSRKRRLLGSLAASGRLRVTKQGQFVGTTSKATRLFQSMLPQLNARGLQEMRRAVSGARNNALFESEHVHRQAQKLQMGRRVRYSKKDIGVSHPIFFLGGRLRGEIYGEQRDEGEYHTFDVISPTPYAKYQEFGTRHNPAHPFLRPAVKEAVIEYRAALRSIGQGLQRVRHS